MLNRLLIKSLLIITFLLNCQQIWPNTNLKIAAAKIIVTKNVQHDPFFRIYTGKTVLVNLSDAHDAYQKKNYVHTGSNLALAAIACVTFAAYPPEGRWESYTFPLSDNQTNALKIATVITVVNALANGFFPRKKDTSLSRDPATFETIAGICCCAGPFIITVRPAAIQIGWAFTVNIGSYLIT